MTILKAHFDGRFIVPEEPVDLPKNRTFEVHVHTPAEPQKKSRNRENGPRKPFPTFEVDPGDPIITSEDVRRALDED